MTTNDIDAIRAEWLRQCGPCDAGLLIGCTCPKGDVRSVVSALCDEIEQLREIVKAAEYEYGARWCMEGDCDHAGEADEDAPDDAACPLIETRHATAAEILAVELLLISNEGDPLDDAEEIPVGEIRRVMHEAREEVSR